MSIQPWTHWYSVNRKVILCCVVLWASGSLAAEPDELPTADGLLREVIGRLPRKPVAVAGVLQSGGRGKGEKRTFNVELQLAYGTNPPTATYTIRDAFGSELERLTITREGEAAPQYTFRKGAEPAPAPRLAEPIRDTDICWSDLSFSFLWWRDGKTVGRDMMKGQACYVLDVRAPEGEAGVYSRLRLWIDEKFLVLLQAEGYDAKDQLVRRLSVKSFKKMDDKWMLKDLDVQSFPRRTRTTLRVTDTSDTEE